MDILLLYGGRSGEHEISLVSASAVARNIARNHSVHLVSIRKDGAWYEEDGTELDRVRSAESEVLRVHGDEARRVSVVPGGGTDGAFRSGGRTIKADVVFPMLHGTYGEDGTVQGLLEMAGVPYVGCGVFSSAATMDKEETKILWQHAGLPTVPHVCLTRADVNDSAEYDRKIKSAIEKMGFPLFVKPCSAGSSDGASKAADEKELSLALMEAFLWDNKVLVEKAINAREIECSVMGNSVTSDPSKPETAVTAYGPGEIVPSHDFYDYDAKYNDPDGAELRIPASLKEDELSRIRDLAKKAYCAVGASGLSRVDFFIDRDDGALYLNEINTLPGFTAISMFPKMCESEGLGFTDLIEKLLAQAKAQFAAKSSLRTSRS